MSLAFAVEYGDEHLFQFGDVVNLPDDLHIAQVAVFLSES
jgi:hypothetical protein